MRKMSKLLHGLDGVEVMDDVLIYGTEETLDKCLKACLQHFRDASVNLNKDKCEL